MNPFRDYLERLGHAESSIACSLKELRFFKNWCQKYQYDIEQLMYKDMMNYISFLQDEQGVKQITIAKYLSSLKHYYQYLIQNKQRTNNPLRDISIKGIKRKVYHRLFDEQELEELYLKYNRHQVDEEKTDIKLARERNKAILGLFVFQGLDASNVKRLKPKHIDFRAGLVHVPCTRKSNSRSLSLHPLQMLDLLDYVNQTRVELIQLTEKYTEDLFLSLGSRVDLQNVFVKLSKQLKKQQPKFTGFNQLRASRITRWIQTENLREAQHRAGHKYISSTENYKVHDIDSLARAIEKFHPLA